MSSSSSSAPVSSLALPAAAPNTITESSPAPIRLRQVLPLVMWEMAQRNPAYKGLRLVESSLNDLEVLEDPKYSNHKLLKTKNKIISAFDSDPSLPPRTKARFPLSPYSKPSKVPTDEEADTIYHIAISGGNCFYATKALQLLAEMYSAEQLFLVELPNEASFLTTLRLSYARRIFCHSFQTCTAFQNLNEELAFFSGATPNYKPEGGVRTEEPHCFLVVPPAFPTTTSNDSLVIDLTRMQYGPEARGTSGETYFLGREATYYREMREMCTVLGWEEDHYEVPFLREGDEERLKGVARAVFEAVLRGEGKSCEYCGKEVKEGKENVVCSRCGVATVCGGCGERALSIHEKYCKPVKKA